MFRIFLIFFISYILLSFTVIDKCHAIPLPSEAVFNFTGTFTRSDTQNSSWSGENLLETEVSGLIDFSLQYQKIMSGTNINETSWAFAGQTYDNRLIFNGGMENSCGVEFLPPDSISIPNRSWDPWIWISVEQEGETASYGWPAAGTRGPDWNLVDNSNFLPQQMWFEAISEDSNYVCRFEIDLFSNDPEPVPEPATVLLCAIGLAGLLILRRVSKTAMS